MKPSSIRLAALLLFCSLFALPGLQADTTLEKSMKQMGKAYKELSQRLSKPVDSDKSVYLALAETLKSAALSARDLVPEATTKLPEDQKAAMVKSYRESMEDFVASVDRLIGNIGAGKWDETLKDMSGLKSEMKDGHREFRKED